MKSHEHWYLLIFIIGITRYGLGNAIISNEQNGIKWLLDKRTSLRNWEWSKMIADGYFELFPHERNKWNIFIKIFKYYDLASLSFRYTIYTNSGKKYFSTVLEDKVK